jgi:hypothetical protein
VTGHFGDSWFLLVIFGDCWLFFGVLLVFFGNVVDGGFE